MKENEIRIDPRTGFLTIIAAERNKRPSDFEGIIPRKVNNTCPFDPGNENQSTEIMRIGNPWKIRVVENKFPELRINNPAEEGMIENYKVLGAYGKNEVIIDTPNHNVRFYQLEEEQLHLWINVLAERETVLYQLPKINHVFIFKNDGEAAGESLIHPHTQIMASSFLPEIIQRESQAFAQDPKLMEKMSLPQLILEDTENFVAIAPYASRFPGESLIYTKKNISSIMEMSDEMRKELVFLLKKILNKYASMFSNFSYNLVFHEKKDDPIFRFHVEIYPRVSILAGIELGEGVYVNTLPPEVFADSYKTQASPLEVK